MPPLLTGFTLLRHRFLVFLIWQSIVSTLVFSLSKTLSSYLPNSASSSTAILSFTLCFVVFPLSKLLFSSSLTFLFSSQTPRPAQPWELALVLLRVALGKPGDQEWRERATVSVRIGVFMAVCAVAGFSGFVAVGWGDGGWDYVGRVVGFRGFVVGLVYGVVYVLERLGLSFPIFQDSCSGFV